MNDLGLEVGSRSDKGTLLFTRSHGVLWWDPCFLIKKKEKYHANRWFLFCLLPPFAPAGPRPTAARPAELQHRPCPMPTFTCAFCFPLRSFSIAKAGSQAWDLILSFLL